MPLALSCCAVCFVHCVSLRPVRLSGPASGHRARRGGTNWAPGRAAARPETAAAARSRRSAAAPTAPRRPAAPAGSPAATCTGAVNELQAPVEIPHPAPSAEGRKLAMPRASVRRIGNLDHRMVVNGFPPIRMMVCERKDDYPVSSGPWSLPCTWRPSPEGPSWMPSQASA